MVRDLVSSIFDMALQPLSRARATMLMLNRRAILKFISSFLFFRTCDCSCGQLVGGFPVKAVDIFTFSCNLFQQLSHDKIMVPQHEFSPYPYFLLGMRIEGLRKVAAKVLVDLFFHQTADENTHSLGKQCFLVLCNEILHGLRYR